MGICYSSKSVYVVRFFDSSEKNQLLDTVESFGICIPEKYRQSDCSRPGDTCTFAVDLRHRRMEYLAQPFICAAMASSGVRFYSVPEFCRLAELGFPRKTRTPIFHVPHDGTEFPPELMASVCVPQARFLQYHEKMRDTGVHDMIPRTYWTVSQSVRFPISRLLCDVERFIGPEEIMERYGMGFCYERAFDGTVIKTVDDELRAKTFPYYQKHHERVDQLCRAQKRVLLLDMHSFSEEIVPRDMLREGEDTPDVCIGTDADHTPERLAAAAEKVFRELGFRTARNYPYDGCYVPSAAKTDEVSCIALMLEFNKRIYCDKNNNLIPGVTKEIRKAVEYLIADCVKL